MRRVDKLCVGAALLGGRPSSLVVGPGSGTHCQLNYCAFVGPSIRNLRATSFVPRVNAAAPAPKKVLN